MPSFSAYTRFKGNQLSPGAEKISFLPEAMEKLFPQLPIKANTFAPGCTPSFGKINLYFKSS